MRVSLPALILASLVCSFAQALPARDTADGGPKGSWSVGLFNPGRYALTDGIELQAHPLVFFVAPNAVVRIAHAELAGFRLTGEYGLSGPTPAMRLSQGFLFPAWDRSPEKRIGWFVVPRAGLVASRGALSSRVLTFRADVAYGVRLSRNDATPLGGVAPLDLLFAPVLSTYRARAGVVYDVGLSNRFRLRGEADLWLHGEQPSPVTVSAGLGLDIGIGDSSRLTFGLMWWNADTNAIDYETHERVRSNDFLPTLDFIWAG